VGIHALFLEDAEYGSNSGMPPQHVEREAPYVTCSKGWREEASCRKNGTTPSREAFSSGFFEEESNRDIKNM
jgi:hypothetical protein